ncbi:hypothetical protein [Paenibacillus campinasensis]|uniref:Uncharacterized protein n=1 Tax=Paenibacillus campinasensis TaxID=66347 RepID=A0A268ELE4_9BACL|nr:hypothetical protein [Paenibacillus campinasensis]PAD73938.1 hypothetical protein CHH67_19070 [Paenibacillus campinasensis]
MDQKTLEYMGQRVDKARNIQRRIKELQHFISYSEGRTTICIIDRHNNGPRIRQDEFSRLFDKAIGVFIEEMREEIRLLEQELAEL